MSDFAIRVTNLSKRYRIGAQQVAYHSLRESITDFFFAPFRKVSSLFRSPVSEDHQSDTVLWALKDISFDVRPGEVVGIIGRNGAGKSTLLKNLARITEPTSGQIEMHGRLSSLLEVGTGFHPELTGRENIYLNGAILGMHKAEIEQKFDEIVEFSGVSKFIDTPMKRYSSGMQVRLAFAVAAHLEPEILLVDEVLAVGDAEFQKKCLGKMQDVAQSGRTILFVSHNMSAIRRLCSRCIVLDQGQVLLEGPVDQAINEYLKISIRYRDGERTWDDLEQAPGSDIVKLVGVRTKNSKGEIRSEFDVRDAIDVEFDYVVLQDGYQLSVCCEFLNPIGHPMFVAFDEYIQGPWGKQQPISKGFYTGRCSIPKDFLQEGDVILNVRIFIPPEEPEQSAQVRELEVLSFKVVDLLLPGGARGTYPYSWGGPTVRPRVHWQTNYYPLSEKQNLFPNTKNVKQ